MYRLLDTYNVDTLTGFALSMAAKIAVNRYATAWEHFHAIQAADYEPLNNYDMTETDTPMLTKSFDTDQTITDTGSNSGSVYGFNSGTAVPQTSGTDGNTRTITGLGTKNVETQGGSRTLTRSGNIGITTSQQMAESELKLWKWTFIQAVYEDLDRLITVPIYD